MKVKAVIRTAPETLEEIKDRMRTEPQKEVEKYQRDVQCGGVRGTHYIALHSRYLG